MTPAEDPGELAGEPARRDGKEQEADDREDSEQRMAADAQLVAMLAQHGFSGPVYEKFQLNLYGYGRPILMVWLKTGEIFAQCRRRNLRFNVPPRPFTFEDRSELADHTLAAALPVFRRRALIEGGWNSARKAALTTYFVNGLPLQFCNVYRSWCRQVRKEIIWENQTESGSNLIGIPEVTGTSDPQLVYIIKESVQEGLKGLDATTRSVLIMLDEGYQYAEIGEVHGITARAVEGIMYRHRKRVQRRQGDDLG